MKTNLAFFLDKIYFIGLALEGNPKNEFSL